MGGAKTKILLIEDSGFMRIYISDLLQTDMSLDVVATATNGLDGVEKVRKFKPDVVITDMVMPEQDGLYVVKELMKDDPRPIILLSSLDRTDQKIFDALKEGAFDFIDKPKDRQSRSYPKLINMVKEAAMVDYLKMRQRVKGRNTSPHTFNANLNYDIIVIGASTGGPSALEALIEQLPSNLSVPVLIAQHMPGRFIESFATRMAESTKLNISVVHNGASLMQNHIYMAPGNTNMRIERSPSGSPVTKFVDDKYKEYNDPSVDCLFESVGQVYGKRAIGVILTGMGKDGTLGLQKIKEMGGLTIAQDEATSIVYGMPKSAFTSGAATHQIALLEIPSFIISAL